MGSWVYDEVPQYRLSPAKVKDWLAEKFPGYEFTDAYVQVSFVGDHFSETLAKLGR